MPSSSVLLLRPPVSHLRRHWLNLTDANARNSTDGWLTPAWKATEEYGIPDVSPASWVALAERMKTDHALHQKWLDNRNKGVSAGPAPADATSDACGLAECNPDEFAKCTGVAGQKTPQVAEHKC